jgi:hypothetical protein
MKPQAISSLAQNTALGRCCSAIHSVAQCFPDSSEKSPAKNQSERVGKPRAVSAWCAPAAGLGQDIACGC